MECKLNTIEAQQVMKYEPQMNTLHLNPFEPA